MNIDTTKKEKMNPRMKSRKANENNGELTEHQKRVLKYIRLKIYLVTQFNLKKADLMRTIAKILQDC